MGPHKIIQGEKRVEGKSQRNLNIEGHVQGKGVYRNQQKTVIREIWVETELSLYRSPQKGKHFKKKRGTLENAEEK